MTSLRIAVIASSMLALGGCLIGAEGSGVYGEEHRQLSAFDRVEVSGGLRADIQTGPAGDVIVRGDDNLLHHIITEVSDGRLEVWPDVWLIDALDGTGVMLTVPALRELEVSGGSRADATGLDMDTISVDVSGGSHGCLAGSAKRLELEASGGSRVEARTLRAEEVSLDVSGGSNVNVSASRKVTGDASGGSKVRIVGPAAGTTELTVDVDTSGGSDVYRE